jgi:hypothetical protein
MPSKSKKNADKATSMAQKSGLPGAHNGKQDAFRHALWNALNARDIGEGDAKKFANAHEATPKQPDEERKMDLHNNAVGRESGANNPDSSDENMAGLILDALDTGKLITEISNETEATYYYGKGVENVQ